MPTLWSGVREFGDPSDHFPDSPAARAVPGQGRILHPSHRLPRTSTST